MPWWLTCRTCEVVVPIIGKRIIVKEETLDFHRRALVVDLHTDSMLAARVLGLDFSRRHRAPEGFAPWRLHADVPRLREGGIDAIWLGIVTHPWPHKAYDRALRSLRFTRYVLEKNDSDLALATGPGELVRARESGRLAIMLGVEGMHMLGGRLERIEALYGRGVRYITMAHFSSNRFAVSSADPFFKRAHLSELGASSVREMNRLGMIIDVAHTHSDLIAEVCEMSARPVIVSHGAAQALRPTYRNLSDDDIRAVAGTGGVIGVTFCAHWLSARKERPPLEIVVDHADHIRRLVGVDHLALGSDWDGFIETPDGMRDAADLPALTQVFFDRGYTEEEVAKILGLNFMRVFEDVADPLLAGRRLVPHCPR